MLLAVSTYHHPQGQRIALRQYVVADDVVAVRDDQTCYRKTGTGPRRSQPGVGE